MPNLHENDNPNQFKFHKANPKSMDTREHMHRIEAFDPDSDFGDWQGHMQWHPVTGELHDLFVEANVRRRGIATEMWKFAHKVAKNAGGTVAPRHSTNRTNDGNSWAKSVSRNVPRRKYRMYYNR